MAVLSEGQMPVAVRHALGRERVPLLVIDDAHPDPNLLVATARGQRFARTGDDVYPGVRSAAPDAYAAWLARVAAAAWPRDRMAPLRAMFAIARDSRSTLTPIQRIPHVDTDDPQIVAAVHYLCDPAYGGTGFYRHRRTGYERIDRRRGPAWRQALSRDFSANGAPDFERIGGVAVRFNRLILYPANCLHSGDLDAVDPPLASDPGRLTVTTLLG